MVIDYKIETIIKNKLEEVMCEIEIMAQLNHSNVIKLHKIMKDDNNDELYMVMDYADEGQLLDWDHKKLLFYSKNVPEWPIPEKVIF